MMAILTIDVVFDDLTENELFDLAFDQNKFLVNGIHELIERSDMKGHVPSITVWNPYEKGCGRFYGNTYHRSSIR